MRVEITIWYLRLLRLQPRDRNHVGAKGAKGLADLTETSTYFMVRTNYDTLMTERAVWQMYPIMSFDFIATVYAFVFLFLIHLLRLDKTKIVFSTS